MLKTSGIETWPWASLHLTFKACFQLFTAHCKSKVLLSCIRNKQILSMRLNSNRYWGCTLGVLWCPKRQSAWKPMMLTLHGPEWPESWRLKGPWLWICVLYSRVGWTLHIYQSLNFSMFSSLCMGNRQADGEYFSILEAPEAEPAYWPSLSLAHSVRSALSNTNGLLSQKLC